MTDDDGNTIREFGDPLSTTLTDLIPDVPAVTPLEVVFDRTTLQGQPGSARSGDAQRTFEVWTQKSLYVVDSSFRCIEVNNRATGKPDPTHALVGSRLAGGQRKYGKTLHQTRPLPVPGTEAVFEVAVPGGSHPKIKTTSKVERVVLRIRVVTVVLDHEDAWDEVTNALLYPGSGRMFED
ncbi:MAG: hypothetical protein H0T42_32410 [Deltaproteobacteria bacterium]|nr:hypothetical protein [Deltaproteobacteria bacterium]